MTELIDKMKLLQQIAEFGREIPKDQVIGVIARQEAVNRWVPVSENPKDEERIYLVQLDSGGMRSCRWTNANPFWADLTTDWHWNIFDIPQYCKVVAWMDLEPYKGGEDE